MQVFLEQLVHILQEPGWAKRTLSSKYWESVSIADCCSRSQKRRIRGGWPQLVHLPQLWKACLFPTTVTYRGFKMLTSSLPCVFIFSVFGNQKLKTRTFTRNQIYGGNQNITGHAQGNAKVLRKPEMTLSLHLRLILRTERVYNN